MRSVLNYALSIHYSFLSNFSSDYLLSCLSPLFLLFPPFMICFPSPIRNQFQPFLIFVSIYSSLFHGNHFIFIFSFMKFCFGSYAASCKTHNNRTHTHIPIISLDLLIIAFPPLRLHHVKPKNPTKKWKKKEK